MKLEIKEEYLDTFVNTDRIKNIYLRFADPQLYPMLYRYFPEFFNIIL